MAKESRKSVSSLMTVDLLLGPSKYETPSECLTTCGHCYNLRMREKMRKVNIDLLENVQQQWLWCNLP